MTNEQKSLIRIQMAFSGRRWVYVEEMNNNSRWKVTAHKMNVRNMNHLVSKTHVKAHFCTFYFYCNGVRCVSPINGQQKKYFLKWNSSKWILPEFPSKRTWNCNCLRLSRFCKRCWNWFVGKPTPTIGDSQSANFHEHRPWWRSHFDWQPFSKRFSIRQCSCVHVSTIFAKLFEKKAQNKKYNIHDTVIEFDSNRWWSKKLCHFMLKIIKVSSVFLWLSSSLSCGNILGASLKEHQQQQTNKQTKAIKLPDESSSLNNIDQHWERFIKISY